jgi:hypothetical protein
VWGVGLGACLTCLRLDELDVYVGVGRETLSGAFSHVWLLSLLDDQSWQA